MENVRVQDPFSHGYDHTIYVNQRESPPPEDMKYR